MRELGYRALVGERHLYQEIYQKQNVAVLY